MDDYTTIQVPSKVAGLIKNLADNIKFRHDREQKLVKFIYSKNISQTELGEFLEITKAAVSLAYPKEEK